MKCSLTVKKAINVLASFSRSELENLSIKCQLSLPPPFFISPYPHLHKEISALLSGKFLRFYFYLLNHGISPLFIQFLLFFSSFFLVLGVDGGDEANVGGEREDGGGGAEGDGGGGGGGVEEEVEGGKRGGGSGGGRGGGWYSES